nr:adenylyl-sulfate kinase [Kineosporia mesophila]
MTRRGSGGPVGTETVSLPEFTPLKPFTHGPARAARQTPAQVRAAVPEGAAVLAVPVTGLLTAAVVEEVRDRARKAGHHLLWIAVAGAGRKLPLPADGLWRAVRDVAAGSGDPAVPVAVPRLTHTDDAALLTAVARGYGATEVLTPEPQEGELHPAFAREYARAVPPPHRRGLTLFFTGLSGSGKSTVAKALAERLLDHTTRTVSLLDGDEVRRMLSAGLTFSRADRELNIRRIGYVAAEITRHGGLAVCAPIAPFEAVREQVRAEVQQAGDFVLVHIATPLEECERRDRKGLYARARRGEIPDFTGISSPYELPVDPELRIDTTGITVQDAVDQVWSLLTERGYLTAP